MWYYNSNNGYRQPRHPRRRRSSFGFPWFLLGFIWIFMMPRFWWGFIGVMIAIFIISSIIRAIVFSAGMGARMFSSTFQPFQSTEQMNNQSTPYYTPRETYPSYDEQNTASYEQGYQGYQERSTAYDPTPNYSEQQTPQASNQEKVYQEYEQPHAQYPQQMPPMA